MRLDPDKLIYGVAPDILRTFASKCRLHDAFSLTDACKALGAPHQQARPVLSALVKDGFLDTDNDIADWYRPLQKFKQLALAAISQGITRQEAEAKLAAVIARAREINAGQRLADSHVKRLAVFGSYLTDAPVLGDLDIAYEDVWIPRDQSPERNIRLSVALRGRDTALSLHHIDEVISLGTPYQVVFEADITTKTV